VNLSKPFKTSGIQINQAGTENPKSCHFLPSWKVQWLNSSQALPGKSESALEQDFCRRWPPHKSPDFHPACGDDRNPSLTPEL
jgi:hypothetical protein